MHVYVCYFRFFFLGVCACVLFLYMHDVDDGVWIGACIYVGVHLHVCTHVNKG